MLPWPEPETWGKLGFHHDGGESSNCEESNYSEEATQMAQRHSVNKGSKTCTDEMLIITRL